MNKIGEIHLQLKKVTQDLAIKKVIFYLFIVLSFLGTFNSMNDLYGDVTEELMIYRVLPYTHTAKDDGFLLKNYVYYWTNLMVDSPITFIINAVPSLGLIKQYAIVSQKDIPGFFEDQGGELFSLQENQEDYMPKLPTPSQVDLSLENYKDPYYLLKYFVTGISTLEIDGDFLKQWDFYGLMNKKLRIDDTLEGPKVLIFHTHSREKFKGGKSVVDVGAKLKDVLEKEYDLQTLHVTNAFYKNDSEDVTGAYEIMEPVIQKILKENPSIQVCIDIHRDGVTDDSKFLTQINGKDTAKFMFFNGVCMSRNVDGDLVKLTQLQNPYLEDNLAFSFQMQALAYKYYPGLTRKIFFREYRYSLHMKPFSTLIEVGNQNNTGEEALNAVEPMANIIAKVFEKD